jgi:hypothetical protein
MTKTEKTPAEKLAAYAAMLSGASRGGQATGQCKARTRKQAQAAALVRWAKYQRGPAARTAARVEAERRKAKQRAAHNQNRADKRAAKAVKE